MRRHPHKLSLNNKTLSTREQAKKLKKKVYAIVDKANSEFSAERRISRRAATLVVKKSLVNSVGLEYSLREYRALKALSEFINLAHNNKSITASVNQFTDLLPVGHPSSTKKHAMTASAFTHARLRWVLADPRIPFEAKPLVASVLVDAPDSESYIYSLTRLESDPDSTVPLQSLIAAFGDGNSSAARSLRARMQRRDRFGRFAYMGGGMRALIQRAREAGIYSFTADPVAETEDGIVVETPDGVLRKIKVDANVKNLPGNDSKADLPVEFIKARLELKDSKDGFSPTPARVKTGDPVIKEEDMEILDMPPGFRKDESYKGPGTKYTDDAYDVIKHDKPSPETRNRIEKAVKDLDAVDKDLIQEKKGEGRKIWDAERPVYEISRRGAKSPFAFTQSWADTQDKIADDEPKMDFEEGRAQAYIPRRDPNDVEEENLKKSIQDKKEEESPTTPPTPPKPPKNIQTPSPEPEPEPEPEKQREVSKPQKAFEFNVPQDSYALNTFGDYEPEGKTDQEAEDYTDDPEVLSEKFTSEELNGALVEALYPSVIDSDETTDIVDAIESDDPDAFPSEDAEEPTAEDLEGIEATDEEPVASAVNAATGYGTLSFDGGDELVPAEAIYSALKKQGVDADRQVARIYDDINGDTENIDALTEARGGIEETDIADVIDEVDIEEATTEEPWKEDWNLNPDEMEFLNNNLEQQEQFFETEDYTFMRNAVDGPDVFEEEINIYEGQWEPGAEKIGRIEADGSIDWENDEQFDIHSESLWKYFDSLGVEEDLVPEVPTLIANLSDEDFARFQETKDHREFLPENLVQILEQSITGGYPDTYFYDFSRDPFFEEDQISLGQDSEKPFVTTNPFEVASIFTTDSLKLGFEEALYNRKNGTSKFTFLDENDEEVEFDMPFESIRDALQLQGVDTDDMIKDITAQNNVSTEDLMNNEEYDAWLKQEKEKLEKQKQDIAELEKQQEESVAIDEKAQEEDAPLTSLPPAEPMAVSLMGEVSPKELQPGDVSIQDGFVITQISEPILSRNGVKYKVQGYYPGHKIQDTKMWNETTPIKIYRGIPVPPPGDLPTLSKYGWQVDLRKGWITQQEFDEKMAGYNEDLAKAKSLIQFPDSALDLQSTVLSPKGEGSIAPKPDEIDTPEKIGSTPQARKPFVPTFQGRFAELVREAEGDPEKFKELINKEEFIIFDYETTGLDVDDSNSQPFQLSAIKVKNGEITDRFNVFMKPDAALTEWNTKNSVDEDGNPLTQEWIDSQKSRAEGHKEFLDWTGDNPLLAGYNVGFDEGFLRKNSDEAGLDYAPGGIMDVLGLAKSSLWGAKDRPKKFDAEGNPVMQDYGQGPKQATSNTLQDVSKYFKVELENWHDSRSDIEATKGVFDAALDKSIENKKDSRKLSAFNVDKQMTDYLNKLDSYEKSKTGEVNPDANESESAGVPAEPSTEIINNPSQLSSVDDSYDPVTSVPASELQANDIAVRKNDAFVIVAVATDPETDKIILNGYYPGHKIQEKIYNSGTEISVVRGTPEAELPQPGDKEPIERPDKNETPAESMDRKTQEYKERVSNASRAYTRNPLNNPNLDRTSITNKRTNSNTPEGRTNEWIRNPENTNHMFGISASEIKEGDYVKVSRPEDPTAYVYVTNVESDPSTKKMKIDYTHTITGVKGTLNWNEKFRKGLEVRRPMTEQERASKRPLDFEKDGDSARYISADGKTPIQEGDSVSDIETGNSGNVVDFIKNTPDATPETADYVIADNPSGDTFLFIPDKVESKESKLFIGSISDFLIKSDTGVFFDPEKDMLEQFDKAIADDKFFMFSYNGKNRIVNILKTKDGKASIWTNPKNGNQNLRVQEMFDGGGEEKNFTLSKIEKYNPELDKGAEPDFGFTKEEVKNILNEERDLVSEFESQGMPTSDAQAASEAEIKKKYGKTSTEALTDISKEEANEIFVELFKKELDTQVDALPPSARENFKPEPSSEKTNTPPLKNTTVPPQVVRDTKEEKDQPGEDDMGARLRPMSPEEIKEYYGDRLENNPFKDIITQDPLLVQALDVYQWGNEPTHPNFGPVFQVDADTYENITGVDKGEGIDNPSPEEVIPRMGRGYEDLIPPIFYLEYVRGLLENAGNPSDINRWNPASEDSNNRINKSIKALKSFKEAFTTGTYKKLTPENEKLVDNLIDKLERSRNPEGVVDQDSGFERQREERMEQAPPESGDTETPAAPSGKKTGFTAEERKKWKDSKVEAIIDNVTDAIIASLEKGEIVWQKGWTGESFFPTNASTGIEYKGLNIFSLLLAQELGGYSTNRWIGKKQGEGMGGTLKPDQEGTEILAPKIIKVKVKDKDGKEKEEPRVVGFNFATVYNVEQFDGLNLPEPEKREPVAALDAEKTILELYKDKPEIVYKEMSSNESPHWTPSTDIITLPKREQFTSSEQLLETLLHELAHSTGHPKRLKRDLLDTYSKHRASRGEEELIADMTAAMVASYLGVNIDLENTAAYIQSWLQALRNDRSFIYRAAVQASKAMDYMLGNLGSYGKSGEKIAQEKEGEAK